MAEHLWLPSKSKGELGEEDTPESKRAHLKLGRPSRLGWGSWGPWEGSWRDWTPRTGSCAENSSRCLRGRGSSPLMLIRGETGAGGGSLMLCGEDGAQEKSSLPRAGEGKRCYP